eukprot:jgi/Psemu1/308254/fgenesh1_kg.392_\
MVFDTIFRDRYDTDNTEGFRIDPNDKIENHARDENRKGVSDRYHVEKDAARCNEMNQSWKDRYYNENCCKNSKMDFETNGIRKDRYSNTNDASKDKQAFRNSNARPGVVVRDRYDVDNLTSTKTSNINNSYDGAGTPCSANGYFLDRHDDFKENENAKPSITDRYSMDMDRYF